MAFRHVQTPQVVDFASAEEAVQSLGAAVRELQLQRGVRGKVVYDVELADATEVSIGHNLGYRPFVQVSPPRGASASGRIEEVYNNSTDFKKLVVLKATGFGATVKVNVRMF